MMIPVSAFLHNPTSEFNGKIDAPLDVASENGDVEIESKGPNEQQVEHEEIRG